MRNLILTLAVLLCITAYSFADDYYYTLEYSTANLDGDEAYTSAYYNVRNYKSMNVNVLSSDDSATGGVDILFYHATGDNCGSPVLIYSANGGGWSYTAGSVPDSYAAGVRGECARVIYTNGAGATSSFKIEIFLTK